MTVVRGGFPPQTLQQIRDGTDITEVISRYVTLSKAGQNYKGLCPFHSEKTPSFSVSPARQMFYCFGCGIGGDAISFLMKKDGLGFIEAVTELAERAGVELPRVDSPIRGRDILDTRGLLESLHSQANSWFQSNLLRASTGNPARSYLSERGIHPDTIQEFGIGFAPPGWDGLIRHFRQKGISQEALIESGLGVSKNSGQSSSSRAGVYDRFRNRIMFPISNLRGQVIAFGGRILTDGTPKYINSPETPIFNKGRSLFGLDRAREEAQKYETLILVEGYFDVMALHQVGIKHVVAPLGTALTKEHVDLIRRFAKMVVLVFDGDSAGVGATLRTLELFANSGISVKVLVLPEGEDPDSFIRRNDAAAFFHLQDQARSLLDFVVDHYLSPAEKGSVEARVRAVDDVLHVLRKTNNPVEREEYIKQVGERLGIRQQLLIDRYPNLRSTTSLRQKPTELKVPPRGNVIKEKENREERDLVLLLLQGAFSKDDLQALQPGYFTVPAYRRVIEMGLQHISEDGSLSMAELYSEATATEEGETLVAALSLVSLHLEDIPSHIQGCFESLERKRLQMALDELIVRLRVAEQENRQEDIDRLIGDIDQLRKEKAHFAATVESRS